MTSGAADLRLEVRRTIPATAERLFDAWTDPDQLLAWWGPEGVRCSEAVVELRIGGRLRLGNELPNGQVVFIEGEFVEIDRPRKLVYTWSIDSESPFSELVTVLFVQKDDDSTEVVISHERIRDEESRTQHGVGWAGCMDGLAELVSRV